MFSLIGNDLNRLDRFCICFRQFFARFQDQIAAGGVPDRIFTVDQKIRYILFYIAVIDGVPAVAGEVGNQFLIQNGGGEQITFVVFEIGNGDGEIR